MGENSLPELSRKYMGLSIRRDLEERKIRKKVDKDING